MRKLYILPLICALVFWGGAASFAVSPKSTDEKIITIQPNPIGAARHLLEADNFVLPAADAGYYFEIHDDAGQLWKRVPVNKAANESHTVQFPVEAGMQPGPLTYTVTLWKARAEEPPVKMAETRCAFNILASDALVTAWVEPYNVPQGTKAMLHLQTPLKPGGWIVYQFRIDTGWRPAKPKMTAEAQEGNEMVTIPLSIESTMQPGLFTSAATLWKAKIIYKLTENDIYSPSFPCYGPMLSGLFSDLVNQEVDRKPLSDMIHVRVRGAINICAATGGKRANEIINSYSDISWNITREILDRASKIVEDYTQQADTVYSFQVIPSTNAENRLLTAWMEPYNIAPGTKATLHLQTSIDVSPTASPAIVNTPETAPQGPGNPVPLLVDIRRDVEPEDFLNVQLFEDKNPESGLYYYMPKAYNLIWDDNAGYRIRMSYLAATQPGQAGTVLMDMDLDAGTNEFALKGVKLLLQHYAERHRKRFSELLPFPFEGVPKASFSDDLSDLYNVSKVVSQELSDFLAPFRVSWVTDSVTKENMQLALINLGINGTLDLTSSATTAKSIAVKINLADPATFGKLLWTHSQPVQNKTPYPLRFKYLHALLLQANQREPIIYSWDLHNTTIPPGSAVELDSTKIPSWLNNAALRMWIEYGIADKSEQYNSAAIEGVTGGVSSSTQSDLMFQTFGVFSTTDIYEIDVRVRSQYFDPRSKKVQTKYITLSEDRQGDTISGIYSANWESTRGDTETPLFEYAFTVFMSDGTPHPSEWIPCNTLRVRLGTFQIKEALGYLPGEKEDMSPGN